MSLLYQFETKAWLQIIKCSARFKTHYVLRCELPKQKLTRTTDVGSQHRWSERENEGESIKYLSKAVVLVHAFCVVEKLSIKPWKAWKFLSFGVVELVTMKASGQQRDLSNNGGAKYGKREVDTCFSLTFSVLEGFVLQLSVRGECPVKIRAHQRLETVKRYLHCYIMFFWRVKLSSKTVFKSKDVFSLDCPATEGQFRFKTNKQINKYFF